METITFTQAELFQFALASKSVMPEEVHSHYFDNGTDGDGSLTINVYEATDSRVTKA